MSDIHEIDLSISDHRPRVAAERRERMRQRLIESALLVFSEKGVESSMIHDVVLTANVSQGTFYNYFRSCDELLIATGEQLKNELLILIEQEVRTIADPAERLATGLRLFLHTTQAFPLLARFAHQTGLHIVGHHVVEQLGDGRSRVVLSTEATGALATFADSLTGKLAQRYIETEAAGLKRRSESAG